MELLENKSSFFKAVLLGPLMAALILLPITIIGVSISDGKIDINGGAGIWLAVAPFGYINAVLASFIIGMVMWKKIVKSNSKQRYIYSAMFGFFAGAVLNLFSVIRIITFISGIDSTVPSVFETWGLFVGIGAIGAFVGLCFNFVLSRSLDKASFARGGS